MTVDNGPLDRVEATLDRHFWRWSALLVLLLIGCTLVRDARLKLWTDELFTLYTARQGGITAIVDATADGLDGAPPLYAILVAGVRRLVPNDALAVRLPSTLASAAMLLCMLAFCRRRLPAAYAFVPPLLIWNASWQYASEGRSYGLVMGCAAAALLFWQAAADGRRRALALALLSFSLMMMVAAHYYSIFFVGSLCLAELVRAARARQVDIAVLAATALPPLLVLAAHYPLLVAASRFQMHFWSPARVGQIPAFYRNDLLPMLVVVSVLAIVAHAALSRRPPRSLQPHAGLSFADWVLAGTLATMPVIVVSISMFTTHAFVSRYLLWAIIGFAVLMVGLLCAATRQQSRAGTIVAAALVAIVASRAIRTGVSTPTELRFGERIRQQIAGLPRGAEPIVVSDVHAYMELSYYGDPEVRERLIYPLSLELELHYSGTDTAALLLSVLRRYAPLRIEDLKPVLAAHPRFILAATPSGLGDYLPRHLAAIGYRVVPREKRDGVLYDVQSQRSP